MKKVLFVCTGNTCRSPMAEALFRSELEDRGLTPAQVAVSSAGLMAAEGASPSQEAVEVMKEIGIDISAHRSRQLTPKMVEEADRIYVMTRTHEDVLNDTFPLIYKKIKVLGGGISDPFGLPVKIYRECRNQIGGAVRPIVTELYNDIYQVGYEE